MNKSVSIEIKGLGKSLIVSIVLSLLIAGLVYYSGIKETLLPTLANIVLIISVFWGACYVSKDYGSKGLVRGLAMGVAFFILMLIATFVFDSSLVSTKAFVSNLFICLISGALGGIVGIGLSDKAI
ncbi:TIGR04086 family membrane protein [Syntrophomonas palmitatica]|uniref:TIGR04086 family membrane protein n=1 Tax=Syntrophomonas palmitatica TaxID=402877 RepID=UPI0006D140B3|nr:TIGR04086 family membrane protein [Syntrophomonas palmitatica]